MPRPVNSPRFTDLRRFAPFCGGALLAIGMTLIGTAADAQTDRVSFSATNINGRAVRLTATLMRPQGGGRHPAVILMHGCAGPRGWGTIWGRRLRGWGYVVLRPNSFGPRGIRDCAKGNATVDVRAEDALAARRYLSGLGFVDPKRIGVMGMFHGGTAALIAVGGNRDEVRDTFTATVALYPRCYQAKAEAVMSPVLILIGQNDHLSPAGTCQSMGTRGTEIHPLDVMVYPGATHAFDWEGLDMIYYGRRIRYDRASAEDAVIRVKAFFEAHLENAGKELPRRR